MKIRISYSEEVFYNEIIEVSDIEGKKLIRIYDDGGKGLSHIARDLVDLHNPSDSISCDDDEVEVIEVKE